MAILNFNAAGHPQDLRYLIDNLEPIEPDNVSLTPWPPGTLGQLASYIHHTCYSSIREVSICAAIACAAGVVARGYRTPTMKPLAIYIMLLARSGVGKDGLHEGVPRALRCAQVESASYFCNQVDVVSGPALHNLALRKPGSVILFGEFGQRLVQMMQDNKSGPMATFKDKLTKMHAKDFLEGAEYADAAKCLEGVEFPSISFVGESTLGTYIQGVNVEGIEDGTLPRFLTINYEGGKNPPNVARIFEMDEGLRAYWTGLVAHCSKYQRIDKDIDGLKTNAAIIVNYDSMAAKRELDAFEEHSRKTYNQSNDIDGNPWNRSHFKALILASICAVLDNYTHPRITMEHIKWAIDVVSLDIAIYKRRVDSGEISGGGDAGCETKVLACIDRYFNEPLPASAAKWQELKSNGIIPRAYLSNNLIKGKGFNDHPKGGTTALHITLAAMESCGKIETVSKEQLKQYGHFTGQTYFFHCK